MVNSTYHAKSSQTGALSRLRTTPVKASWAMHARPRCPANRLDARMIDIPSFWYGFAIGFLVASILALAWGLVATGRRR